MKRNKIKAFFKHLSFGLLVGIVIGILGTLLLWYVRGFLETLISNLAFATGIMAIGTLILAFFTYLNIRNSNAQEKRDRKESILNEIKDWIFDIKDITLEPVTEDTLTFRQLNIELRYGVPMNRVELLEIEIEKILKDQDLKEKVSKVAKLLAAVMVFDRARDKSGKINESVIAAFPGYVNTVEEILSVIDDKAKKTDKTKEVVAYEELNNAEAEVLGKIVSLKSDLLKP